MIRQYFSATFARMSGCVTLLLVLGVVFGVVLPILTRFIASLPSLRAAGATNYGVWCVRALVLIFLYGLLARRWRRWHEEKNEREWARRKRV